MTEQDRIAKKYQGEQAVVVYRDNHGLFLWAGLDTKDLDKRILESAIRGDLRGCAAVKRYDGINAKAIDALSYELQKSNRKGTKEISDVLSE
ncbi:hypothetical protein AUJ84_03660 [Candidatus Pacearchaeota archaeon CG1_02_32_132]|nr:MAG: hypothetical protein AUJ84_03660 [Candidatus Pacearchaeota archaeon CG1_02_32_132]